MTVSDLDIYVDRDRCPYFFSADRLSPFGLNCVDNPADSSVIFSSTYRNLENYIYQYGDKKKYFIWCDEPIWSSLDSRIFTNRINYVPASTIQGDRIVVIYAMNIYTGEFFQDNHYFLHRGYFLDPQNVLERIQRVRLHIGRTSKKRVATLLSCRSGDSWEYKHSRTIYSLNAARMNLALEGYELKLVDIYGKNWPHGMAIEDSRDFTQDNNPWQRKLDLYGGYSFAITLENTVAPHYVTEKIWHAILAGCIPVYCGQDSTIYEDFKVDSFIDTSSYKSNAELFSHLENMSDIEYSLRYDRCLEALVTASLSSVDSLVRGEFMIHRIGKLLGSSRLMPENLVSGLDSNLGLTDFVLQLIRKYSIMRIVTTLDTVMDGRLSYVNTLHPSLEIFHCPALHLLDDASLERLTGNESTLLILNRTCAQALVRYPRVFNSLEKIRGIFICSGSEDDNSHYLIPKEYRVVRSWDKAVSFAVGFIRSVN